MEITKDTGPYILDKQGNSVIETNTILNDILKSADIAKHNIKDLAVEIFLNNEVKNIKSPSTMYLLALKKVLLYATPVIAPNNSNTGIVLTSQVITDAVQYSSNKTIAAALTNGDKFRLIGFSFEPSMINHLAYDVFQWKFFRTLPSHYRPYPISIGHLNGIEEKVTKHGSIFLIKPKHYEDVSLYNEINKLIGMKLNESISSILAIAPIESRVDLEQISRIEPFNQIKYIERLNEILPVQIDRTFSPSYYECLKMTSNWLLYDRIELIGIDSQEVVSSLAHLAYVKEQNLKVLANKRDVAYKILLSTRAEKITREKYPFYFDYTDRRAIFVRFNRFSITKLPTKEQNEIKILLEKELAMQYALLHNKCEHVAHVKSLKMEASPEAYKRVENYINFDAVGDDKMYPCKLCSYPLMCAHEVDLYDALSSIDKSSAIDQGYVARQKIINQYKIVDQRRTGGEGTDVSYTYYCKFCSSELGKTDDIIQSSIKTQALSNVTEESGPTDLLIYLNISNTVKTSMNQSIVPMNIKTLIKLIYNECRQEISAYVDRAFKVERDNIEKYIKYLCAVYTLACLISININVLKSNSSIMVDLKEDLVRASDPVSGGAVLKDELLRAFRVVSSNNSLKGIGITDDKIKGLLIEAFKFANKIFASDSIQLKSITPREKLTLDINTSPLIAFADYMYNRKHKDTNDAITLSGVNLDKIYPKSKKTEPIGTHALYKNIYLPTEKETTDLGKYIYESYKSIVDFVIQEPIAEKYTSIVTQPISDFSKSFQLKTATHLKLKRTVPVRFLPVINSREHDFTLDNYHIAYCLEANKTIRAHRWETSKVKSQLIFKCAHCGIRIEDAEKKNNRDIDEKLLEQMNIDAFFELYTLACPIKDAHVFDSNACEQCGITKMELVAKDLKYYKKYLSTYSEHRKSFTTQLIADASAIMSYSKEVSNITPKVNNTQPDKIALESLSTSLNKLFAKSDLQSIATLPDGSRSLEIVESYVRLFYSHYTFVKNISVDTRSHSDSNFFRFIKSEFFEKTNPKKMDFKPLPAYPSNKNADTLLTELFQIIFDTAKNGNSYVTKLIQFLITKMLDQDSRRKQYNFMKLKSVAIVMPEDEEGVKPVPLQEEADEDDIFDGYDISIEDMDDNIDGDID